MLTLFGTQGSGSAAVEAALDIAGIAYRCVDAASWKPSPGLEELKAIYPLAQIPTLVLDDGSVHERERGDPDPSRPGPSAERPARERAESRRAQQIRGLVYIAANCYAGIGILDFPERWYPEPDAEVKAKMQARGKARMHELWQVFADQFPATPWLSGDRLGALDILAAVGLEMERCAHGAGRIAARLQRAARAHRGRATHRRRSGPGTVPKKGLRRPRSGRLVGHARFSACAERAATRRGSTGRRRR